MFSLQYFPFQQKATCHGMHKNQSFVLAFHFHVQNEFCFSTMRNKTMRRRLCGLYFNEASHISVEITVLQQVICCCSSFYVIYLTTETIF